MKLADVSIRRPVFATMMIGAIVVFGVVLYGRLNVDLYPEVNFPIVTVTTLYPGADPETMESQVADPIEEALNSLGGIRSLRSVSLESVAQVFIEFDLDVDPADATQEVRDRLGTVTLPDGIEELPRVQKLDLGAAPVLQLAVSGTTDIADLTRYIEDRLKPALERVPGAGQVDVVGSSEREIHVYVDPQALRSRGLTFTDVTGALATQNIDLPGGRIDDGERALVVRTTATAATVDALSALVLTTVNGVPVRLGDLARVEDGFEERTSAAWLDDQSAIALIIRKQSDANTVEVADAVDAALVDLRKQAPPGVRIDTLVDNSRPIRASIETVQFDLVLGALLAVVIIFIFLRDLRATIISALALPTSVIGTFAFVSVMGFTLNMMTTLALSLSIGILIDDAIVVIENIVRRKSVLGEKPMEAASRGTAEIGLAVLATTLSIVAVFVPVAFMDGMIGQFFFEFGLTVAFAVLLSLFVSFTLTPMLSARFLAAHHGQPRGLSRLIEAVLVGLERGYRRLVRGALRHRFITLGLAVAALIGTFMLLPRIGFEFTPIQDNAQFNVKIDLPPGTSLAATENRARAIADRIHEIPGVTSTFTTIGGGDQAQTNAAVMVVSLVPREERAYHQTDAMAHVRAILAGTPRAIISVEPLTALGSGNRNAAVQLDLRGSDLAVLAASANQIADKLRALGGYVDVDTTARPGKPEFEVAFDRERAADVGVNGLTVARTVRGLVAGEVATEFESEGERYDVRVQLPPELREAVAMVESAQVRTAAGKLVEIRDVGRVERGIGPSRIDREARQRQVSIYANLEGKALGNAITEVGQIATDTLPPGVTYAFGGSSRLMRESLASMGLALFLAIICVYMILASQFESFAHPFTIMMSLPFSLIGAFGGLLIAGQHMSIFAMIGLIMLMGLVTKNAILLVDFANQLRGEGESVSEALENAGAVRLRPILMTTAAMIFGMLPVAIGHGTGGEVRAPMGVVVIGGLITSTVLTLVVVPAVYALMEGLIQRVARLRKRLFGGGHAEAEPAHVAHAG
ncbi:MAG: efflux RND transporter permease subunit [Myxococcales bacterium]|nr:efflux RND transporter permease subunit [Myxococcales bacterium]